MFRNAGIGVDTHVHRISNRLGWVESKTPEDTRLQLEDWLPPEYWREVNHLMVGYGQLLCKPIGPMCSTCPVRDLCPKIGTRSSPQKRK
jgi:endonuclease-3